MITKKLIPLLVLLCLFSSQTIFCMKNNTTTLEKHIEEVENFITKLEAGSKHNDTAGSELLFDAITCNSIETITLLLKYGVNTNYKKQYKTVLTWPQDSEYINKATLLLEHGANPTLGKQITSHFVAFLQTNTFGIYKGVESIYLVYTAQENWTHMSKNEFAKVCTNIFEKYPKESSLVYNALFALRSKKRFKEFELVIKDKLNLEKLVTEKMSPQLLKHFLECGIYEWDHKMFKKFLGPLQKKDMMIYQYNDNSILQIPYYDILLKYHNQ